MRTTAAISSLIALTASMAMGDPTLQEKTQMHFGGALGGVINVFGRKATHEGIVSDVAIHGNRKMSRSGDTGEIVDLDEQKVYYLDYDGKTYKVVTFDELRRLYEEAKENAKPQRASTDKSEKSQAPEYEVEFSIKPTGNKETINGWNSREEIATVTVHEKGRPLEDAGGFVLTSDMWIGPRVPAMREMVEFELKFMQKVYGDSFMSDMRQAAAMFAATPAFAKAMKTFNDKQRTLEGTAIRSKMTFETVAGKNASTDQLPRSHAAALGGLLGRMKQRRQSDQAGAQRSTMLDSNHELLKASTTASAADVAVLAGFREK